MGRFGSVMEHVCRLWGGSWSLLEPSWGLLASHVSAYGSFWLFMAVFYRSVMGPLGAILGPLGAILGRSCGALGKWSRVNWGDLGVTFSAVGFPCDSWFDFGLQMTCARCACARARTHLGSFWSLLGGHFCCFFVDFASIQESSPFSQKDRPEL